LALAPSLHLPSSFLIAFPLFLFHETYSHTLAPTYTCAYGLLFFFFFFFVTTIIVSKLSDDLLGRDKEWEAARSEPAWNGANFAASVQPGGKRERGEEL